jgi:hypothetical protein
MRPGWPGADAACNWWDPQDRNASYTSVSVACRLLHCSQGYCLQYEPHRIYDTWLGTHRAKWFQHTMLIDSCLISWASLNIATYYAHKRYTLRTESDFKHLLYTQCRGTIMPFYIHMPDDCFTLLAVVHPLLSHFCRDFSAKIVFHRCSSVLSVALDRTHAFSDLFSLVASFWWGYRLISKSSPYM